MIRMLTLIALVFAGAAIAQPEVKLKVKLDPPELRESGDNLDLDDIKEFNLYKVDGDDLTPLLESILYDGSKIDLNFMTPVDTAEGIMTVCAKTVDKLLLETSVCEPRLEVPYEVPPPGAPTGLTVEQVNDININLNLNINITGEQ